MPVEENIKKIQLKSSTAVNSDEFLEKAFREHVFFCELFVDYHWLLDASEIQFCLTFVGLNASTVTFSTVAYMAYIGLNASTAF